MAVLMLPVPPMMRIFIEGVVQEFEGRERRRLGGFDEQEEPAGEPPALPVKGEKEGDSTSGASLRTHLPAGTPAPPVDEGDLAGFSAFPSACHGSLSLSIAFSPISFFTFTP